MDAECRWLTHTWRPWRTTRRRTPALQPCPASMEHPRPPPSLTSMASAALSSRRCANLDSLQVVKIIDCPSSTECGERLQTRVSLQELLVTALLCEKKRSWIAFLVQKSCALALCTFFASLLKKSNCLVALAFPVPYLVFGCSNFGFIPKMASSHTKMASSQT